ncbi:hypothetical protein [Priestia endophytica]|uniref:hypothetical protein n=1 Tax=Priestia endophytica TaxID=135735 RepID=UPI00227F4BBC|nr:hypothetical protein [Priestia endophytica]MCY8235456.1 hypothetical protein [Priestia endophytica]
MGKYDLYRGFRKKSLRSKSLLILCLISLITTLVTFKIADDTHSKFYVEQDYIISEIKDELEGENSLTKEENQRIRTMVQVHQNNYPSYQYLALYPKEKNQMKDYQYDSILADLDLYQAQYVYPLNQEVKRGFLADSFYISEAVDAGEWYIVQQYHPTGSYYYEITVVFFSLSLISLILYVGIEIRRYLKIRLRLIRN